MKKHIRELTRALRTEIASIKRLPNHSGHVRLEIKHIDGRAQKLTVASSPSNDVYTVRNAVNDVKKFKAARAQP
jgi:hypothetical protein